MNKNERDTQPIILEITLYSILFLFFFQLIVDFIEGIYAFGLLGTSIPTELVAVLLLFSPLLMLFFPRGLSGRVLVGLGYIFLLSRSFEVLFDTRLRMIAAGVGVACFLILFPSLIWIQARRAEKSSGLILGMSLTIALVTQVLFRVVNSGLDISTDGSTRWLGWVLVLIAGVLLLRAFPKLEPGRRKNGKKTKTRLAKVNDLALGVMAVFILLYFAYIAPNVIARWTESSYLLILAVLMVVIGLFALVLVLWPQRIASLNRNVILLWNVLFVASLVLTLYLHQIKFPAQPVDYPLYAPEVSVLFYVPMLAILILFPIVLIDFILFCQEIVNMKPSYRSLGGGFSLASLFLLVMIFAHVFTTTYDYIPVVGPFFRDKFWLVYLAVGVVLTFSASVVNREDIKSTFSPGSGTQTYTFAGFVSFVSFITIALAILLSASPEIPNQPQPELKILTYNIQQGYSDEGLKNYGGQLDVIRGIDADIIGLQESDTNRIANGNADIVRYFADKLNMYSYFGPKTVTGTFGIALLSKFPIENPRTFYMYSEGEQTATIEAQITVAGEIYNVYVTHLGNGGPLVQQQAILEVVEGVENVILIGDFNFRPDSEQYSLTTQTLDDAWLFRWPGGVTDQGIDPLDRIDHTFLTPGTTVDESTYNPDPASDHPYMWTVISW